RYFPRFLSGRPSLFPLFFLLLPRPPLSALFPYTTLFRSALSEAKFEWVTAPCGEPSCGERVPVGAGQLRRTRNTHNHCGFHGLRSEEHTSELQSRFDLVCRLLLEKKKTTKYKATGEQSAS